VRSAGTDGPREDHVVASLDPLAACEVCDLRGIDGAVGRGEVEGVECLHLGEARLVARLHREDEVLGTAARLHRAPVRRRGNRRTDYPARLPSSRAVRVTSRFDVHALVGALLQIEGRGQRDRCLPRREDLRIDEPIRDQQLTE